MNTTWETIADCLRDEVAGYARLLSLFEEQQRLIFRRDPSGVLRASDSIREQVQAVDHLRGDREVTVAQFALAQGRPPSAPLRSLIAAVAPEARPLLAALISDINRLTHQVRRAARLSQRLLASSVEIHQELLRRLQPGSFNTTYAANGRLSVSASLPVAALQTTG